MPLIGLKKRYKRSDIEKLRAFTASLWPKELSLIHGVEHWDRVAEFGKMLYVEGADMDVIMAFAYLHDSERKGDGYDYDCWVLDDKYMPLRYIYRASANFMCSELNKAHRGRVKFYVVRCD